MLIFEDYQEQEIDQIMSDRRAYEDHQGMREVPDFLVSLHTLSGELSAAISVAERQVAILQDLHAVFSTSYQVNDKARGKGYPLKQNPFSKNAALAPTLSACPEQAWPNISDTIDHVVQERKSFIEKIRGLVGNVDIKRNIVYFPCFE